MEHADISDTLIQFGSELKSTGETATGWGFGGWLVVFGSQDASRYKDKFTKSTDFDIEDGERRGLYYNHGLDGTIKRTRIGDCRVFLKDAGVWIEGQIKKRNDYLKQHAEHIATKIEEFGLSSGAPAHLVERKSVDDGHEILLWPIAEASITPTPAEPLTGCVSLKSVLEDEELKAKTKVGEWRLINEANVQIGGPIHKKIEGDSKPDDSGKDKKKPPVDGKDKKDGKDKDDSKKPDKPKDDDKGDKPSKKLPKSQADLAKRIRTGSAELMELQRSMRQGYRSGQDTADRYTGKSLEDEELVDVSDEDYAVYEAVITEAKSIDGLSPWSAIDAARRSLLSLNEDALGQISQLMHPDHKEYRRETEDFYTPTSEQRMEGIRKILSDYVTTAQALIETMSRNAQALATKSLEITNNELPAGLLFEDHSDQVLAAVGVFVTRVEDLAETRCVKSERRWSAEKFRELADLADGLKSAGEKVESLAQAHAPRREVEVSSEATKALAQIELTRALLNGVKL